MIRQPRTNSPEAGDSAPTNPTSVLEGWDVSLGIIHPSNDLIGVPLFLQMLFYCLDDRVQDLFVDTRRVLATLAQLTEDHLLLRAVAANFKDEPIMLKHPWIQKLDYHDLLTSCAVGQSDAVLSRRFLVERSKVAAMRHDLERRYQTMFRWLNDFRRMAQTSGYAANGDLREYIDGLKSSDIARRDLALEHAVRWLMRC